MMRQSFWCGQLEVQHLQGPGRQDRLEQGTVHGFARSLQGVAFDQHLDLAVAV